MKSVAMGPAIRGPPFRSANNKSKHNLRSRGLVQHSWIAGSARRCLLRDDVGKNLSYKQVTSYSPL